MRRDSAAYFMRGSLGFIFAQRQTQGVSDVIA
jgi:hypothetical protein